MEEVVVLVNERDEEIGQMPKMEAHVKGVLHRAFSIFVFDVNRRIMLQQRALTKYHSPGLWTNTCCSHPREGEAVLDAGLRRLQEEMGFVTELNKVFDFVYKSDVGQGLIEHEFDHVLIGHYNAEPVINPAEVEDWKWMEAEDILKDMEASPDRYTVWFRIAMPHLQRYLAQLES